MDHITDKLISRFRTWMDSWGGPGWVRLVLIVLGIVILFGGAFLGLAWVIQMLWAWVAPDIGLPTIAYGTACKVVVILVVARVGSAVRLAKDEQKAEQERQQQWMARLERMLSERLPPDTKER